MGRSNDGDILQHAQTLSGAGLKIWKRAPFCEKCMGEVWFHALWGNFFFWGEGKPTLKKKSFLRQGLWFCTTTFITERMKFLILKWREDIVTTVKWNHGAGDFSLSDLLTDWCANCYTHWHYTVWLAVQISPRVWVAIGLSRRGAQWKIKTI